jgi:hypothetical protein
MKEWSQLNKSKLSITFSDQTPLRRSQVTTLSRVPADSISFQSNSSIPDEGFSISNLGPTSIHISVPMGLSHKIVEQRQKSMLERRKLAEKKRKNEEVARQARQLAREEQREEERRIRQEQKRYPLSPSPPARCSCCDSDSAQKAEVKAQLLRSQQEAEEKQKKVLPATSRKFSSGSSSLSGNQEAKGSSGSGGAGSELAAAMARRRAAAGQGS